VSPPAGPTVGDILERAVRSLTEAGVPDARQEAQRLVAHLLGTDRGGVAARKPDTVPPPVAEAIAEGVRARAQHRPFQQIVGRVSFHGLELEVDEHVLIPRPETEDLVDAVLEAGLPGSARIADLGTGSGCIAVALAVLRPAWSIVAIDLSAEAIAVARRNAERHGVDSRVRCVLGDFRTPDPKWGAPFDAIASNPPYVPEAEWERLAPEIRDHEPKLALTPGPTGNEAYAAVVRTAHALLVPGGLLALELGWTSERAVRAIVAAEGFQDIGVRPDAQGIPRILTARR
jgi:release factor glutamine methyltransferase